MDPILIILIGIVVVLAGIIVLKLHPVISLLLAALAVGLLTTPEQIEAFALHSGMSEDAARSMAQRTLGKRIATAFGNTAGKIGVLIALASIIGTALMRSGGAERIVRGLMALFGRRNSSLAFLSGSFTLAIPVFFDTVFYLMIPLVKSIGVKDPRKYGLFLMTVIAGGVMAHSLIPPTPGPLFVAEEMGIDLGVMMIAGLGVGAITVICGYFYAVWANQRWDLPLRDTPDISIKELEEISAKDTTQLPGLGLSLLPIWLPIVLITGNTLLNALIPADATGFTSNLLYIFTLLGDSTIALFISALIAMYLLWMRLGDQKAFQKFIQEALLSAGVIILITCSGGAFGQMMQQTGIGIKVAELASHYQMAILPLAFVITAVVRTAQGSATVAMVTAIGVMSGLANMADLAFHPVYIALVIGCGSKIFAWMNDSAYWIITKMVGMTEKETIRHFSYLLAVMGVSGLIAVMILAQVFPMV